MKALFASPNCPKWTSFEYAYNDNWYVTFDCEDDAKDAYRYLREEVQSFQGRPLMARIKAKTMLSRTVYLPKSTPSGTSSTPSPPADSSTTHFTTTAQPVAAYNVAHPQQIFSQQQANFPFYTTNVNGIIPAGQWFNTRFIQPEVFTFYTTDYFHFPLHTWFLFNFVPFNIGNSLTFKCRKMTSFGYREAELTTKKHGLRSS